MRLFLAGFYEQTYKKCFSPEVMKASCILGSYFYLNNRKFLDKFDPTAIKDFMFDSGAFTYIHATGNNVNWKEYARRYAHFVKDNNIKNYIELDIDIHIGYERVVQLRNMIEDIVGRPCIPVYHPNRTEEQFREDCKGRPYVSFGSMKKKSDDGQGGGKDHGDDLFYYTLMKRIVDVAHEEGSKIHLLGISDPSHYLRRNIGGDSADSTTWIRSSNFGYRCIFNEKTNEMEKTKVARKDMLLPSWKDKALSFALWRQFATHCATKVPTIWPEDANGGYPTCDEDTMTVAELTERYRNADK